MAAKVVDDFTLYIGERLSWKTLHEMMRGNDLVLRHAMVTAYDNAKQAHGPSDEGEPHSCDVTCGRTPDLI
jgi:hypothetical protein